jgi:hypothetical protein
MVALTIHSGCFQFKMAVRRGPKPPEPTFYWMKVKKALAKPWDLNLSTLRLKCSKSAPSTVIDM